MLDCSCVTSGGPTATAWPREGAHFEGTFDHYDGNADLPCDSSSDGEDD